MVHSHDPKSHIQSKRSKAAEQHAQTVKESSLQQMHHKELGIFRRRFRDSDFGLQEARAISRQHGLNGIIQRRFEGSNLVFEINNCWLKLFPRFWRESYLSELCVLKAWHGKLSVAMPELVAAGELGDWSYIVTSHVPGDNFSRIQSSLTEKDMAVVADDVGTLIGSLSRLEPLGLLCNNLSWSNFVANQVCNAEEIYRKRGHTPTWARRIAEYLQCNEHLLRGLSTHSTIHADLNHEHLLFDTTSNRLCGVIDFADAIDAPMEVEFVLPFLCLFRGDFELQRRAIAASNMRFGFAKGTFSDGMMMLTLLSRFINFEEWFDGEIGRPQVTSVSEVAAMVFPEEPT
jgi:hygromycin-B 7''-O-kinase